MPLTLVPAFIEEQVLVPYLKAYAALNALVGGRVSTKLPPKPYLTFPSVRLQRRGGAPNRQGIDKARIQFDCYGRTAQEAFLVYQHVYKALIEMPEVAPVHGEVVVYDVAPLLMRQLDDPSLSADQPQPRFIFDTEITYKAV